MDVCCWCRNKQVGRFDDEYAINACVSLSLTSSMRTFFTCVGKVGGGVRATRCSTLWMGCLSAFGVWVSGPGGNWKANFISLKEETKEDAGWKKVPFLICKATAWHIRNLYAQLTTGRLIFPLQLFLSASLPIKQSYRFGLKQLYLQSQSMGNISKKTWNPTKALNFRTFSFFDARRGKKWESMLWSVTWLKTHVLYSTGRFFYFPCCLPLLILWLVYLVVAVVHIYVYPVWARTSTLYFSRCSAHISCSFRLFTTLLWEPINRLQCAESIPSLMRADIRHH